MSPGLTAKCPDRGEGLLWTGRLQSPGAKPGPGRGGDRKATAPGGRRPGRPSPPPPLRAGRDVRAGPSKLSGGGRALGWRLRPEPAGQTEPTAARAGSRRPPRGKADPAPGPRGSALGTDRRPDARASGARPRTGEAPGGATRGVPRGPEKAEVQDAWCAALSERAEGEVGAGGGEPGVAGARSPTALAGVITPGAQVPVRTRSPHVSRGWDAGDRLAPPGERRSPNAPPAGRAGRALGSREPAAPYGP